MSYNPTNNFELKTCLFGTFTYNGWGIAFDGKGYWSFDDDTDGNIGIFVCW